MLFRSALKRREPDDPGWLALDSDRVSPVDPTHLLHWNGQTDQTTTREYLPWFLSAGAVVWEGSACRIVDEAGRYDGLSPYDYSELMLNRAADAVGAVSFLDKLYPGKGQAIYDDRGQRLANILVIRASGAFRKAPGAELVA